MQQNAHTQPSLLVHALVASVPHSRSGLSGMIRAVVRTGLAPLLVTLRRQEPVGPHDAMYPLAPDIGLLLAAQIRGDLAVPLARERALIDHLTNERQELLVRQLGPWAVLGGELDHDTCLTPKG